MPLSKQVIFRVLSKQERYTGVANSTEVTLGEDEPQPDAEPITVVFRSLGDADAAQFPTGKRVIIVVGSEPAPDKATSPVAEASASVLSTLSNLLFGSPDPKQ